MGVGAEQGGGDVVRGIMMTAHSVLALIAQTKTQTRRLDKTIRSRRYSVGEVVYVREAVVCTSLNVTPHNREVATAAYAADGEMVMGLDRWPWKRWTLPSMFMPEGLHRFRLEITEVREQRLQQITDADAWAEGADTWSDMVDAASVCRAAKLGLCSFEDVRASYLAAWAEMHGWASLRANPRVVVYSFKQVPR